MNPPNATVYCAAVCRATTSAAVSPVSSATSARSAPSYVTSSVTSAPAGDGRSAVCSGRPGRGDRRGQRGRVGTRCDPQQERARRGDLVDDRRDDAPIARRRCAGRGPGRARGPRSADRVVERADGREVGELDEHGVVAEREHAGRRLGSSLGLVAARAHVVTSADGVPVRAHSTRAPRARFPRAAYPGAGRRRPGCPSARTATRRAPRRRSRHGPHHALRREPDHARGDLSASVTSAPACGRGTSVPSAPVAAVGEGLRDGAQPLRRGEGQHRGPGQADDREVHRVDDRPCVRLVVHDRVVERAVRLHVGDACAPTPRATACSAPSW